jgi:hypothetical protein
MKMRGVGLLMSVAALAGCSKAPQGEGAPSKAAPEVVASAVAVAQSDGPQGRSRKVAVQNDLFDFDYAYPAGAGRIPALKAWLDADLAKSRSDLESSAKDARAEAKTNDYPYHPYATGTDWKVVADLPTWLSLSATVYSDTGGAHPNHGYTALLWDKAAGKKLAATDLFTSASALSAAIRTDFCNALDKQRAKRRDAPVNRASGDEFDACIDPVASTVILGSSDKAHFDRIGVLVGPYEAGPYAEGDYEITLPITAKVLAAVKPQYRTGFALGR